MTVSERKRAASRTPARPSPATTPRAGAGPDGVFPALAELTDWRGPFLIPLLLLLASRIGFWFANPYPSEDAYITFRYARNFAAGHGLVYNPGERVMGFTSPLWTLWSALGIAVAGNPIPWAQGWSLLADLVTLLVGGACVRRVASRDAAWAFTFFFAAWPYFPALTISGMEMSLCLALLLLAAALVESRSRIAGATLGALALTRPEGLAAAAVLSLGASGAQRAIAAGMVAVAAAALTLQFGSPIPNSLLAKASVYGTPGPWAGRLWWDWLSPVLLGGWPGNGDAVLLQRYAFVFAPAFALGLAALWRRRDSAVARATAAALLVWLGYASLGVSYFWWYLALPLLALSLAASVGLPRIVRGPWIPVAMALAIASTWFVSWQLYVGRSVAEQQSFGRIARVLRQRCRPGDTVLLEPIGAIGYTAPVRVLDETGLVSPEVAKRRRSGPGWYSDTVRERHPEWLVIRLGVLRTGEAFAGTGRPFRDAAERDGLSDRYTVVDEPPPPLDAHSLLLLHRRDLEAAP